MANLGLVHGLDITQKSYYDAFMQPPPGARFSMEWGLMETFSNGTIGDWCECDFDVVIDAINTMAGGRISTTIKKQAQKAAEVFTESQTSILSILALATQNGQDDSFLNDLVGKIKRVSGTRDFVKDLVPSGPHMSRDTIALQGGRQVPPHMALTAQIKAIRNPFTACKKLANLTRHAATHLERLNSKDHMPGKEIGMKVCIGHGRSLIWKNLKDFIDGRLHLPWDEFNSVSIAGITNKERLSEMLDEAAIAFIVMTAEDEQPDGKVQPRMNVIHEAGLFQGRLGFERGIILLEEGCKEFSNIQGLGQIRFPKDNIKAAFEEIRLVLEREGILEK